MIALGSALGFVAIIVLLSYAGQLAQAWIDRRWPVGRAAHRRGES